MAVGHWIVEENEHYGTYVSTCSNCKAEFQHIRGYKFCPNCGAKMVEPQESED